MYNKYNCFTCTVISDTQNLVFFRVKCTINYVNCVISMFLPSLPFKLDECSFLKRNRGFLLWAEDGNETIESTYN